MTLRERARAAGIDLSPRWHDAPPVGEQTLKALVAALGEEGGAGAELRPAYVPPALDREQMFGVALQLYQLRSPRNLGIGDLADLKTLLPVFAEAGADFVGLNPLHALFTADPERASPFSPSDRRFLNPLIIAVDEVAGFDPAMAATITVPPSDERVDYTAATQAKLSILRQIHARWRAEDRAVPDAARAAADRFRNETGDALTNFALFEALSHHSVAANGPAGWHGWPKEFAHPAASAVRDFAQRHIAEVDFHAWLQFVAADQLQQTQALALQRGMRIGLYLDLAVGAAPDGAATWMDPDVVMRGVSVGAPPDLFSPDGQGWGLAPFSPTALVAQDYAPFRQMLDSVMGACGAMRIDHAMGLERLYLIPDGMSPVDGAYVAQPGLTEVLVEASHTHRSLAIGEDLGVVPPGFRERMAARRLFSMKIVPFECDGPLPRMPARYARDSLACLSTHDIAPLAAWWRADDATIREAIGVIEPEFAAHSKREREIEKARLLGLAGLPPNVGRLPLNGRVVVALHKLAARSASRLMAIRLEDVVGGRRFVNLPGTDREHPNWRNTLPLTVAEIGQDPLLSETFQSVRAARAVSNTAQ